jgi:hypothetical protein
VKNDWRAFTEALRRAGYFAKGSIIWFLEFQKRGAPHFHFLATDWLPKQFIALAWSRISGADLRACSRVEGLRHPEAAGAYAAKYACKKDQKTVPPEYQDVGRFWGLAGAARALAREGIQAVPNLSAVIPGRLPAQALEGIFFLGMPIRLYETPIGWVIYGTEKDIRRAWNWLTSARSSATTTKKDGRSRQKTLLE